MKMCVTDNEFFSLNVYKTWLFMTMYFPNIQLCTYIILIHRYALPGHLP